MISNLLTAFSSGNSLSAFSDFPGWAHPKIQDAVKNESDVSRELGTHIERASLSAYYTPDDLCAAMVGVARGWGIEGRRVLDLGCGTGRFLRQFKPEDMLDRLVGVEMEPISAAIAQEQAPSATIHAKDLTDIVLPTGGFELVVGNPPYGSWKLGDARNPDLVGLNVLDYFVMRSLKALAPGGYAVLLVSRTFLDKKDARARELAAQMADLVHVSRLPSNLFPGAGIAVDVVVLRKRLDNESRGADTAAWVSPPRFTVVHSNDDSLNSQVSGWFRDHPGDALGKMRFESRGDRLALTVSAPDGWMDKLKSRLAGIVAHLPMPTKAQYTAAEFGESYDKAKVMGLFLHDGQIMRKLHVRNEVEYEVPVAEPVKTRVGSAGQLIELGRKDIDRLTSLIELSGNLYQLITLERTADCGCDEVEALRGTVMSSYESFVNRHGPISRPSNARMALLDPTRGPLLMSLEGNYTKPISKQRASALGIPAVKESVTTAPILNRRVMFPEVEPVVESVADGVAFSLARHGRIDLFLIGRLLGLDIDEVRADLPEAVIEEPGSGRLVLEDEYLSGDIRHKLDTAEREGATELTAKLRAAMPERLGIDDIGLRVGSPWMDPVLIRDFFADLTTAVVNPLFLGATGQWLVDLADRPSDDSRWQEWCIGQDISAAQLLAKAMNNQPLKIYREIDTGDGKARVLDTEATNQANMQCRELHNRFYDWLFESEERRAKVEDLYNDRFNRFVSRDYSSVPLELRGLSDEFKPYRYQLGAVKQSIVEDTVLFDHPVGAGKSLEMAMAVMTQRSMGLVKKPVVVVPDHLVGQIAGEFQRAYPAASLLVPDGNAFHGWRRGRMFAQIATCEFDALIVGHAAFGKLPLDQEVVQDFVAEQCALLESAKMSIESHDGRDKRASYFAKSRIETQRRKLVEWAESNTSKDVGLSLRDLGIDGIVCDEAHAFKNLSFFTGLSDLRGINPDGSNRAMDALMKVEAVRRTGGRVILATGTPIVNSVAEAYTLQRFICPDVLARLGLTAFDAWAGQFGCVETRIERKPAGDYGPVTRLARFHNLPELIASWSQNVNYLSPEAMKAEQRERGSNASVPPLATGAYQHQIAEESVLQRGMTARIYRRFDGFEDNDNALAAMTDARKAAADIRLLVPEAPRFAGTKMVMCAKNILRIYHNTRDIRATQLFFADLGTPKNPKAVADFRALQAKAAHDPEAAAKLDAMDTDELAQFEGEVSIYEEVRDLLIAGGIPVHEIVFAQDLKTDKQRLDLYQRMNEGEVAVLMGSTQKMGTGMNVQQRLIALHDYDAPWRPADLEQRHGRIIRQGNELLAQVDGFEVHIFAYGTANSFDAGMWSTIEVKAGFIQEVRSGGKGKREMEDISLEAANAGTMKALASGDPRVLEHVQVSQEVKELESAERGQARIKARLKSRIDHLERMKISMPQKIAAIEQDLAQVAPGLETRLHRLFVDPDGVSWFMRDNAVEAIDDAVRRNSLTTGNIQIGTYRGLALLVSISQWGVTVTLGEGQHTVDDQVSYKGLKWRSLFAKCEKVIERLTGTLASTRTTFAGLDEELDKSRAGLDRPSPYTARLAQAQSRLSELDEALGAIGELPAAIVQDPSYTQTCAMVSAAWDEADSRESTDMIQCLCMSAYADELQKMQRKALGLIIAADSVTWAGALAELAEAMKAARVPSVDHYEAAYQALIAELADYAGTGCQVEADGSDNCAANEDDAPKAASALAVLEESSGQALARAVDQLDMFAVAA